MPRPDGSDSSSRITRIDTTAPPKSSKPNRAGYVVLGVAGLVVATAFAAVAELAGPAPATTAGGTGAPGGQGTSPAGCPDGVGHPDPGRPVHPRRPAAADGDAVVERADHGGLGQPGRQDDHHGRHPGPAAPVHAPAGRPGQHTATGDQDDDEDPATGDDHSDDAAADHDVAADRPADRHDHAACMVAAARRAPRR